MRIPQLKLRSDPSCFTRTKPKSPDNRATTSQQHFGEVRQGHTHPLPFLWFAQQDLPKGGKNPVNFDCLAFSSNDKVGLACCSSPQNKGREGNSHCGCSTTFCQRCVIQRLVSPPPPRNGNARQTNAEQSQGRVPAHRSALASSSTKLLGDREICPSVSLEQSYGQGHAAQATHRSFLGARGREGGVCVPFIYCL